MNFLDWIGFVIGIVAMTILFGKKKKEDRQRRRSPEQAARQQERKDQARKEFMKAIGIEIEDLEELEESEPSPPPPPPAELRKPIASSRSPVKKRSTQQLLPEFKVGSRGSSIDKEADRFDAQLQAFISKETKRFDEKTLTSALGLTREQAPDYEVTRTVELTRGSRLVKELSSKQNFLIYKEIFGPPMAMRRSHEELW